MRRAAGGRFGGLAFALLLATAGGCASVEKQPQMTRPVWPPPPLPARIEFVRSVVSDEDVGKDTTFSQRVLDFLGGQRPKPNQIVEPIGLAVSDDGQRLYVSDFVQLAIFIFDFGSKKFRKIGDAEKLARPVGIALDSEENLYVVEQETRAVSVFDRQGKRLRSITHASLERPTGIAIDRQRGRIYVADTAHTKSAEHTVKIFDVAGDLVGTLGHGKGSEPGEFLFPTYVTVGRQGEVYVTDTLNSRVQMFDSGGKYVKTFGERGNSWGMFDKPKGVALDSFANVYVVDSGWSNVQIFNAKGQILLFFGGRGPLPGMLKNPTAIVTDRNNQIYVADHLNHRVEVYRLVNTTAEDSFLNPIADTKGGEATSKKAAGSRRSKD